MTLGLYDYERRRRRRFWISTVKAMFFLALMVGIGLFAYQVGVEQVKGRESSLREENSRLRARVQELDHRVATLQAAAHSATVRATELETRLQRELPQGELAELTKLVAERLVSGVDPHRLAFVISETRMPRDCDNPETKRFILPTPLYRGSNTAVGFADGTITISGEGVPARDAEGRSESWFDPQQPVSIRFTEIDGRQTEAVGMLPLQHSVVIGSIEHRFMVTAGARSFVEVTTERCPFP
jgi:hypothetical protein